MIRIEDSDLADIYGYELKAMNQQVKRNIERFPEDFMFQLTKDEVELVKSQIVTSRENFCLFMLLISLLYALWRF